MPSIPNARAIRQHAYVILKTAAHLRRRGLLAAADRFLNLAHEVRMSSLVNPTGDEITAMAHRAHADGQMVTARLSNSALIREDCVACARMWRRVARGYLRP